MSAGAPTVAVPALTLHDFAELSKARIVAMVLVTTASAYAYAARRFDPYLLLHLLAGTALLAAGTNALNQLLERDYDALMTRTRRRPLPDGRMTPRVALVFAMATTTIGTLWLLLTTNALTAAIGAFTFFSYDFIYTPLKRSTPACTIVGAVPGALPALMGVTAAVDAITLRGVMVFAILFAWQLPHFTAISWMYRDDYARAGFRIASVEDETGRATARLAMAFTLAFIASIFLPAIAAGSAVDVALAAAIAVALAFFARRFLLRRTRTAARSLFMATNAALLLVLILLPALGP